MDVKLDDEELVPPDDFPFPFEPYSIQKDFMKNLFLSLEQGKLGIFESPTGTGKSQSLICGSLKWLLEHEERQKRQLANQIAKLTICVENEENSAKHWMMAQARQLERDHSKRQLQVRLDNITKKEERLQTLKKTVREKKIAERKMDKARLQKVKHANENKCSDVIEEMDKEKDDYLLEEDDYHRNDDDLDEPDLDEGPKDVQIIICSRTHSQLSQLVGEIKKSPYYDKIRLVVLSSRNNYCINTSVRRLGSLALINERCCDLQNKKRDKATAVTEEGVKLKKSRQHLSSGGCPFRPSAPVLGEEALADIMDMEDLVSRGKTISACPYYAARSAVEDAQVIVVPYNILLHKGTREASGLKLKNNVVIIDEAHNLLDTIQHIHSAELSSIVLERAHRQLVSYRDKYKTRFTASNILNLNQIIFVVNRLIQLIKLDPKKDNQEDTKVMVMDDFLLSASIDNLNMYNLLNFCKLSKLTQKLQGFVQNHDFSKEKLNDVAKDESKTSGLQSFLKQIEASANKKKNANAEPQPPPTTPQTESDKSSDGLAANAMPAVVAFLECLTNPSEDGRLIVSRATKLQTGSIKFLLLNPASHFVDVVREARSVVVAGGTMKPIAEFRDQLFGGAGANKDRVLHFSCGHVVSPNRILPIVLSSGPTKQTFDFSFGNRDSTDMLNELGRVLMNLSNIVPAGIVCFLTSYSYEKTVINHLEKTGVLEKIAVKKKIFREPKESNQVEKVLQDYAKTIKLATSGTSNSKLNGALLFSVVGGKLSEGLNFSDDLGRCVILFGLPYPNIKSAQLQEKMSYLSAVYGNKAGEEHYENLCMKAVNQTIGRAIRHMGDYATIWLVDKRFARPAIQAQLPEWIQTSLVTESLFGPAVGATARFFAKRKKS